MKKLLLVVILVVVGLKVFSIYHPKTAKLEPQYKEPYIVIYGRKTDGNTVHMQSVLQTRGYRYYYVDVDTGGASDTLHWRMSRAGLRTSRYTLPVVEVNTRIQTDPDPDWVIGNYRIDHTGKKL